MRRDLGHETYEWVAREHRLWLRLMHTYSDSLQGVVEEREQGSRTSLARARGDAIAAAPAADVEAALRDAYRLGFLHARGQQVKARLRGRIARLLGLGGSASSEPGRTVWYQ